MFIKNKKAFTLIELLVVIAIIGLLATIIGVNVNSARNKANTAKSIQFSDNIYHSIGDNCVAYYDFNDTADGTLKDISGNNNTGTIHGAVSTTSLTYSGGNLGNALYFDGVDDYVEVIDSDNLDLATAFTLEAWVNRSTMGVAQNTIMYKGQNYVLHIDESTGKVNLLWMYDSVWRYHTSIGIIPKNIWNHIAVVFDGTNVVFFINGKLDREVPKIGNPSNNTSSFKIGYWTTTQHFTGFIDEVRIYSTALISAQIQQHYAEGLLKYLLSQNP